jgi:hypothetical protein
VSLPLSGGFIALNRVGRLVKVTMAAKRLSPERTLAARSLRSRRTKARALVASSLREGVGVGSSRSRRPERTT